MKIKFEFTEEKKFFNKIKKWIQNKKQNINIYFKGLINEHFLEERFKTYVIEKEKEKVENEIKNIINKFKYLSNYNIGTVNNFIIKPLDETIKKTRIGTLIYKVEKNEYEKGFIDSRALTIDGIKIIAKERGVKLEKYKDKSLEDNLSKFNLDKFNSDKGEPLVNIFRRFSNTNNK